MSTTTEVCSFCGRHSGKDVFLVSSGVESNVYICNYCIEQAGSIWRSEIENNKKKAIMAMNKDLLLKKPTEIKSFLDQYVIGQEATKKVLSVAVYNHYKRLLQERDEHEVEIQKSNIVMVGQTGTGKTLMARTIAQMLNVPLAIVDATVFTEAGYVGEDVESILTRLLQAADYDVDRAERGIVFIDEIDAVGRQRGAGLGGGNDEREQTLNQLLVEMDGFETGQGIILIAATNRPDVLDPALLRPGRFDRQVVVSLPDIRGREQILNVHMRKVPVGPDVQADVLARGTPGMSGADLANLVNEAALFAARRNGRLVEMIDFERAKDKILMGTERRSMVMTEDERRSTAYHESGHAILGRLLPKADPVHKVTIIPRGRALGVTMSLPERDRYSYDRVYMLSQISMLFGGRIAEEVFMNEMTTGASNDFERATHLARDMVTRYGMSDRLGPMVYAENESEVFLGRSVTKTTNVSEETMRKVDEEIRRIIDEQYSLARRLIEENADKMHAMAKALLEWETIGIEQIDDIMAGRPPQPPKDWTPKSDNGPRTPPAQPPAVESEPNPAASA